MNYEKIFIPTLRRLSQLVSRQYGCRFEYMSETDLNRSESELVRKLLLNGQPAMTETGMYFPVMPDGVLVGAALVAGHNKLGQNEISGLNQVIRMILETTLVNVNRLDQIEFIEEQTKKNENQEDRNLIRLEERKKWKALEVEANKTSLRERLSFPFLVEAQCEEDAFRMALEIHDHSGRRSFVPIEDLDQSVFDNPGQIRSLGSVSIYATCFDSLDMDKQKVLLDYFCGPRGKNCPQLIVGTTRSYADLKLDSSISNEFLSHLTVGYLYLNQAFSVYKSGDILEFFFDSLTGRTHLNN